MLKGLIGRLQGRPSERDEERKSPPAGAGAAWTDVFRFSFRDPASGMGGLARLAFNPAEGRVRTWFFAIDADGAVSVLPDEFQPTPKKGVAGEKLIFRCDAPMKRWSLLIQSPVAKTPAGGDKPMKLKADVVLNWEAAAEPFDLRGAAKALGEEGRYEQVGRLSGHLQIGATRAELSGAPCVRSRRWGGPDLPAGPWTNLWMRFGDSLAVSATRSSAGPAGFVLKGGNGLPIVEADLGALPNAMAGAKFVAEIRDAKGARRIEAEATAVRTLAETGGVRLTGALVRGACEGEDGVGFAEIFTRV